MLMPIRRYFLIEHVLARSSAAKGEDGAGKRSRAGFFLAMFAAWAFAPTVHADLSSVLVSPTFITSGGAYDSQYEFKSVSLFVDPAFTNWIAWSDAWDVAPPGTPDPTPYACGISACIGRHGFGTNDYIKMKVTNPLGAASILNMDVNDASGDSSGPQMILFGTAANAPDVRRYNFPSGPYYTINEAGAFNALFTTAGTYVFDFSFRNLYGSGSGQAGHSNIYLLADVTTPVPEPESYALMLAGLGILALANRRRKQPAGA